MVNTDPRCNFWDFENVAILAKNSAPAFTTLQTLMWPHPDLCDDVRVAVRLHTKAALNAERAAIALADGGEISFDTAFNLFPLPKWQDRCGLKDLWLRLEGSGVFRMTVACVTLHGAWDYLVGIVEFDDDGVAMIDLSKGLAEVKDAVLVFSLIARGESKLTGAFWQTQQKPLRDPRLVLGITTFKREAAVMSTVAKFKTFAANWLHGDRLHLVVVDNGQTVKLPPSDSVTLVPNRNLGGSGGFARCLREAHRMDATHALFMDDDASVDMYAIERVWTLLAYATDTATTVIGGLTQAAAPTKVWESGAVFHQTCRSFFRDLDLTHLPSAMHLELHSAHPLPQDYYGGFWFFAFALDHAKHWPFPFFVRGDDINFSLANDFSFVTLPGVVSFQDQDFSDKETSLTLYLDLRNHLIQHLALPKLELSLRKFATIPVFFLVRALIQNHWDTMLTLNMAMEDVMRGPEFFAANADMTERRTKINGLRRYEIWKPLVGEPPQPVIRFDPHSRPSRYFMKAMLNGLFLPFFNLLGNHQVLRRNQRGDMRLAWGSSKITYVDKDAKLIMTVRHDKAAMLRLGVKSLKNLAKLTLTYRAIKAKWRSGFDDLTSQRFWEGQFKTEAAVPDQAKPDRTKQTAAAQPPLASSAS